MRPRQWLLQRQPSTKPSPPSPTRAAIIANLVEAAQQLVTARANASPAFLELHRHRLERKAREIDAALIEAAGIFDRATLSPSTLSPGETATLTVDLAPGSDSRSVEVEAILPEARHCRRLTTSTRHRRILDILPQPRRLLTNLYPPSLVGAWRQWRCRMSQSRPDSAAITARAAFDLEEAARGAAGKLRATRTRGDHRAARTAAGEMAGQAESSAGKEHRVSLQYARRLALTQRGGRHPRAPKHWPAGLSTITPLVGGRPALRLDADRLSAYRPCHHRRRERCRSSPLDLKLPEGVRVGYVGGGNDSVGTWLSRLGLDVTELDATRSPAIFRSSRPSSSASSHSASQGSRQQRPEVAPLRRGGRASCHALPPPVRRVGSASSPPRHSRSACRRCAGASRIRMPRSRCWRRTTSCLWPNAIGPHDWAGWDKERGLYFAAQWDEAYEPLLAMNDANEQPLMGALVSAAIGQGPPHPHEPRSASPARQACTWAFRLMANLVQPA